MNHILYTIFFVFLLSCGHSGPAKSTSSAERMESQKQKQSHTIHATDSIIPSEEEWDATVTSWVLVADTGRNYAELRSRMIFLSENTKLEIDTLGREYNPAKDLIALPQDHEDELYAGEYFPRRYTTEGLSLEYLDFYHEKADPRSIALVSGIYSNREQADSGLRFIRTFVPNAFVLESKIYMGCMH